MQHLLSVKRLVSIFLVVHVPIFCLTKLWNYSSAHLMQDQMINIGKFHIWTNRAETA